MGTCDDITFTSPPLVEGEEMTAEWKGFDRALLLRKRRRHLMEKLNLSQAINSAICQGRNGIC